MKTKTIEKLRRFANYNRVTKFVAKLIFMKSEFKQDEVVCLTFDKNKRFIVDSPFIISGKISVVHFDGKEIATCEIDPKYLMHAPEQG